MVTIIAVRHAPTAANVAGVLTGHADIPLADPGIPVQLLNLADVERCYCSPLLRAVQTAELLLPQLPITLEPRLTERGLGDWEGQEVVALRRTHPAAFLPTGRLDPRFTPPGAEETADFASRVKSFLDDIERRPAARIVLITHAGVVCLLRHLLDSTDLVTACSDEVPHAAPVTFESGRRRSWSAPRAPESPAGRRP